MQALRRQLVESLRAFASLYRNPRLRRLQLAWIGSSVGTWGYVVALMVYAYKQGGPGAVGLVGLIRWFPAAVAAPFGGMVGDRFPRLRVMVVSDNFPEKSGSIGESRVPKLLKRNHLLSASFPKRPISDSSLIFPLTS